MIFPSTLHILLWGATAVLGVISSVWNGGGILWLICAAVLTGCAIYDALSSSGKPSLLVRRYVHGNLPVTVWSTIRIEVKNHEKRSITLELYDHCHHSMEHRGLPQSFTLSSGQKALMQYEAKPLKRGHFYFPGADLISSSQLRLWKKKSFFECKDETRVFPNFKEIVHFSLLATHNNLSKLGIRKIIRRGAGNEFHQLRDYRQGDSLQTIDWKATSRLRRLISKDYQDERDQQIIFVLDSGRRMRHQENGQSLIDQALNSIVLLAYVASRQGDAIGLYSFGGEVKWLPPRKQEDTVRSLLLGMYDIEASSHAADYLRATEDLLNLQRRRSLMVVITNSRAEDHEDLISMTKQLRTKHLMVIADLREKEFDDHLLAGIHSPEIALRYQSLLYYQNERKVLLKKLKHLGPHVLDVTAGQLPSRLVNTYLDIKGSSLL